MGPCPCKLLKSLFPWPLCDMTLHCPGHLFILNILYTYLRSLPSEGARGKKDISAVGRQNREEPIVLFLIKREKGLEPINCHLLPSSCSFMCSIHNHRTQGPLPRLRKQNLKAHWEVTAMSDVGQAQEN